MSELSIPSLSLFNRSPPRYRKEGELRPTNDQTPYQILRKSRKICYESYLPDIVPARGFYEDQLCRLKRYQMEIDYLNAYKDAMIKDASTPAESYRSTQRQDILQSFGVKRSICECEGGQPAPELFVAKNAYLGATTPNFVPLPSAPPRVEENRFGEITTIISKAPYLSPNYEQPRPRPYVNPNDNGSGIINNLTQNLSVVINNNLMGPHRAEVEVQTQDPALNHSSFLIQKVVQKIPQLMNQQNFKKSIRELNQTISNLKIEMNSEDLIIDLSDLVLTKDQYIEQSNNLLSKLDNLCSGKVTPADKNKKKGGIVWPEGV